MVKSLFGKVLSIMILVLLISFGVTGILVSMGFKGILTDQKIHQLDSAGTQVLNALDFQLRQQNLIRDADYVNSVMQTVAKDTNSIIWIVSDDGTMVLYTEIPRTVGKKLVKGVDGRFQLPDDRQIESTKGLQIYKNGDFFGLFKDTGTKWITLKRNFVIREMPPYFADIRGFVLVFSESPEIYQMQYSILWVFLLSGAIGTLVAFFFVLVLSRRFVTPLNQMKAAARRIASGEFTERIRVAGSVEITELAVSFNNMVDALKNLEMMRRDFISNVSHELRTPITTIKGFVDGIMDEVIPPEKHKFYLAIVQDEIKRMQMLVNDLLDLAKMQAGEKTLNITRFDVNELVRRCVISLQQMFIEKDLEFTAEFETERMFVNADRDAIQRVLLNLLQNAIKFTDSGGMVTVRTSSQKESVITSVEDTGRGIPKAEVPFVFDRFYKTDKSRSLDKSGVGLGLAIVRSIILSHGETIDVESEEGRGSRFTFTLRKADSSDAY